MAETAPSGPLINRIRMATVGAPDVDAFTAWYQKWLGYLVVESGIVGGTLATAWGVPAAAGRSFAVMTSTGTADVFIRVVATDPAAGSDADTTSGWAGLELIVDGVYDLHEKFKAGGVEIDRPPATLGGKFASIHAMQVKGPAGVLIALADETGDMAASNLPYAASPVDRLFLVAVGGPDMSAIRDFYLKTFNMSAGPDFGGPSPRKARALGLPESTVFPLSLVRAADRGNTIELHGLPAPAKRRPRAAGQLPPGVAMISFGVNSLDGLGLTYLTPPTVQAGVGYSGQRAATFIGPVGELIELIEEKR